jgi:hypothetical protein
LPVRFRRRLPAARSTCSIPCVLASGTGATVVLGNSVVQGNSNGVFQTGGGSILSFKNNEISNNGNDGTPLTGIGLN